MVKGELMVTCAHVPLQAGSASCFLTEPDKQSACRETAFLLLVSSASGAGDQRALLQHIILHLSLLSFFLESKITFKCETCC